MPVAASSPGRDPLSQPDPIGDTPWLRSLTGWSHDKINRLAKTGKIPGAFRPGRGYWSFRKSKTLQWLESLEADPK